MNASAACFTLVTSWAEGKGRVDPAALPPAWRPSFSRRAGDLRYSLRPTHLGGRPFLGGPGSPTRQRQLGPWVRTGGPRGRQRELEVPAVGLTLGRRPHPSLAAAPPHSGEGKRGRWLLPPPRGQVRLMLQPCARAARTALFPSPPLAQPQARPLPPPPPPQSPIRRPPAPDSLQPKREAAAQPPGRRPGSSSAAKREAARGGCEPGSDFLAPVAAEWKAKGL